MNQAIQQVRNSLLMEDYWRNKSQTTILLGRVNFQVVKVLKLSGRFTQHFKLDGASDLQMYQLILSNRRCELINGVSSLATVFCRTYINDSRSYPSFSLNLNLLSSSIKQINENFY